MADKDVTPLVIRGRLAETSQRRTPVCSYRGSIRTVATQKRSISFDESVLREAELRLAGSGGSLSAFVNAALLHELQLARGRELLAEDDDAELGAVSPEVTTQVLAEWPA